MPSNREAIRRQHRHSSHRVDRHPIVVMADNVDKVSNLGAIIRTSEAFRCETVITNRAEPDSVGAMGAEHWQPLLWGADLLEMAKMFRRQGYGLIALEQSSQAASLDEFQFPQQCVLMVGAEMFGLSDDLMKLADRVVFIPQSGLVKSLNVGTATAIALYEYSRQWWMAGFKQPERHLEAAMVSARLTTKRPPADA